MPARIHSGRRRYSRVCNDYRLRPHTGHTPIPFAFPPYPPNQRILPNRAGQLLTACPRCAGQDDLGPGAGGGCRSAGSGVSERGRTAKGRSEPSLANAAPRFNVGFDTTLSFAATNNPTPLLGRIVGVQTTSQAPNLGFGTPFLPNP